MNNQISEAWKGKRKITEIKLKRMTKQKQTLQIKEEQKAKFMFSALKIIIS